MDPLRSTLAVGATVHPLDLGAGRPSSQGLAEVRGAAVERFPLFG